MWNVPSEKELAKIPKLYEQDGKGKNTLIHLHFFIGNSDWFISEYDGEDTFFGFVCLNGWKEFAEWGYISFRELKELIAKATMKVDGNLLFIPIEIDRDLNWGIKRAFDVPIIKECCKWLK